MDRKYQIFVSSTFEDLRDERDTVIRYLLEMGHFPVGMEMFSASDEESWKVIQRQIQQSDYYVVLVAHRYGSKNEAGISFTEMEYDFACAQGIPTLGFVIADESTWKAKHMDTGEDREKLDAFKSKVKRKNVSFWKSRDDLAGRVATALGKQMGLNPRIGWVRADNAASAETTNELSRLSRENAALREQVAAYQAAQLAAEREKAQIAEARSVLKATKRKLSFFYRGGKAWETETEFSLQRIFNVLAPEMMIEKSARDAADYVGLMLNPDNKRAVRADFPIPSNSMKSILADFAALGLIAPSTKKHPVHDNEEYWTLTPKGKTVLTEVRIASMAKPEAKSAAAPAVPRTGT